ncbi:hypothetical protein BN128_1708 [Cronobacter sakazakii 696]|nr:hypothetical protein BN128_1708 [Cronobacter sakazakii 696]
MPGQAGAATTLYTTHTHEQLTAQAFVELDAGRIGRFAVGHARDRA